MNLTLSARQVDGAAATVLAAAVGFAAVVLGSVPLAAVLAPLAFALATAVLGRVEGERVHRLAGFELEALDPPRSSVAANGDDTVVRLFGPATGAHPGVNAAAKDAGDARKALSAALANVRRSLR